MSPDEVAARYRDVSELFGALSSPARAAIMHLLTETERTVSDLVQATGLSQPLVSQHLRVLRAARLVDHRRDGRNVTYFLADDYVAHIFLDAFHHSEELHHDHS